MPYSVTISRAISVACLKSFEAPVEMLPTTISSAARPAHQAGHLVEQLLARHQIAVLERKLQV